MSYSLFLNYSRLSSRFLKHRLVFIFLLFLLSTLSFSQQVTWGFNVGGTGVDNATGTHIDVNGNVYFCGAFSGTNIDFDPSVAGAALHTSNGSTDGFVAKYTTDGQYILSIAIGGAGIDKIISVTTDQVGNIYITGFFRGDNVDFDPSAAQALLSSNGDTGGDPGYGGDMFVAKYTATGQYVWAFHVGGTSVGDSGLIIKSDPAGNLFVGGYFRENIDFDPSAAVNQLNAANGTLYLARYNTNGQYQWAFNYGQGNVDNALFDLRLDANNNVYVTGYFQGTNIDFDPSVAGVSLLSSNGLFESYVAKYDQNGQYLFAFKIGGTTNDVGRGIVLDIAGNIYVVGDFNGTNIDFDPSAAVAPLTSNGGADVYMAKYTNTGQYVWAYNIGSAGNEFGWKIDTYAGGIFITGGFTNVADFNPSAVVDNLTSNGGYDIFLAKYDLLGNYQCAFNIGSSGDDFGNDLLVASPERFYLVGGARGANVDFEPTQSTFLLSSKGIDDAFLVKYYWPPNTLPNGTIQGGLTCPAGIAQLTFTSSSGVSPFTVVYTDGTTNFTQTNVQTGVPFNVAVNPTVTTTYTLVSISDGVRCSPVNNAPQGSSTIQPQAGLLNIDFAYSLDACDPLIVQFDAIHSTAGASYWDFGDGITTTIGKTVTHTYTNFGNYVVRYGLNAGACKDTINKTISIDLTRDNIVLTTDTTICNGTTKKLLTAPALDFCWTPTTFLDNPNSPQPVTSTTQDITYFFTAQVTGNNLITNGNFSQGNVGFTSEYINANSNTTEGQYTVGLNPKAWNGGLDNCVDHTTGAGNMMMINGSPAPNVNVWKQTVAVTPNTNYAFSTWIEALFTPNPAQLQFSINGKNIGTMITASLPTCTWTQFYTTWNSGNNTSAVISIVNKNTQIQGNDFALDDISFAPVFVKRDSVIIRVDKPIVRTRADTTVCTLSPVSLSATGAQSYTWTPAVGLSNPAIYNPVATPVTTTEYIVVGTTASGCVAKDTVNVNVYTKETIATSQDQVICKNTSVQLQVTGGNTYSWAPAATLLNPTSNTPTASPLVNTLYYVTVTDGNNCKYLDSVQVDIRPDPLFAVNGAAQICRNDSLQLTASGGNIYAWQPATGLSNPSIANPHASPAFTTDYTVTITETACNVSTVLTKQVRVLTLPAVVATRSIDLDCSNDQSQLLATGAARYTWSPSATLNNPSIANPIAQPRTDTKYLVKGTDAFGCSNYDSVIVAFANINEGGYLMPNAFTPNNDGKNDCFGIRYWGILEEVEFSIFNRWGQRIFFTKDPRGCWDGTVNGIQQDPDVFVYMIKGKTICEPSVFRKGTFVLIR